MIFKKIIKKLKNLSDMEQIILFGSIVVLALFISLYLPTFISFFN